MAADDDTHSGRASDPAGAASPPPRLLDQVRDEIRYRHYSFRTEQAYVEWVRRFVRFHGLRHPRELGAPRSLRS